MIILLTPLLNSLEALSYQENKWSELLGANRCQQNKFTKSKDSVPIINSLTREGEVVIEAVG
jgi:hypothetical protein